jgi:hypothetical protein
MRRNPGRIAPVRISVFVQSESPDTSTMVSNTRLDRAHEIRLVAHPRSPNTLASVREVAAATLGPGWQVGRLRPRSRLVLVRGRSDFAANDSSYAREAHEAALALARTGRFAKVEADIPIRGYAQQERMADTRTDVGAGSPEQASLPDLYWAHDLIHWEAALAAMPEPVRGGVGIRIGHPDTGYTDHPNLTLDGLDLDTDRDVIDGDDDAVDDLEQNPLWPLPFPGHGTSTASVMVGHGDPAVGIVGMLPASALVPIRATESVVQVFDSNVAKAVAFARSHDCHVVSMSLGGKGFFGLHDEIQRAVDQGMIVMAAAGNYVRFVTAPASYDNCLAVAATGPGDTMWDGSSRGSAVDVAMPGEQVYVARYSDDKQPFVGAGDGTSFSVAFLAAGAALWLARHGRDQLLARYGAPNLQAAFLAMIDTPGVCVVPPGWDPDWGVGRVDLEALVTAPLPDPAAVRARAGARVSTSDAPGRIAAAISTDPGLVRARLADLLDAADAEELAELLELHEGELVYLAYTDPHFAAAVSRPGGVGPFASAIDKSGVSASLAARLRA